MARGLAVNHDLNRSLDLLDVNRFVGEINGSGDDHDSAFVLLGGVLIVEHKPVFRSGFLENPFAGTAGNFAGKGIYLRARLSRFDRGHMRRRKRGARILRGKDDGGSCCQKSGAKDGGFESHRAPREEWAGWYEVAIGREKNNYGKSRIAGLEKL